MPTVYKLPGGAIQANTITTSQLQTTVVTQIQAGGGPKVKSLIYPGNDTAANTAGGQTLYLTGSGFAANAQILVNGAAVPSQSFISASNISFTTPALSTGTYPVYLINPEDGGTAILYPGLLISGEPTWVTSAGSLSSSQDENSSWNFSLSTTGDTPITYALAAGNTLPSGITLAANGLISGTISSPTGNVTTYTFSVVATDAQNQDSTRQFSVTTSTGEGVLFANNVLLIHADGTNNQNNHTFLDSSNNNFTITRYGNATQGSFSPFSQTGWSNYFDGTGDYLSLSSTSIGDFGTGDFTVEYWANLSSLGQRNHLDFRGTGGTGGAFRCGTRGSDNKIVAGWDNADTQLISNTVPTLYTWTHIAITRSGTTCRLFFNGTLEATTTSSYSIPDSGLLIGTYKGTESTYNLIGYLSGVRIVKGTALYTSNFTPPTAALTAVSNTSLLTCQSNRFIDNSPNTFTITRNGDVSVQAFSPFAPTAAYSTSSVGGSGYFDGSGDYLNITHNSAFNLGANNFCIEGWFYPTTSNATQLVFNKWGTASDAQSVFQIGRISSNFYAELKTTSGYVTLSTATWITNAWNHFAVVRDGSTISVYLNGLRFGTTSSNPTLNSGTEAMTIGSKHAQDYFTGYITDCRIVNGSAIYDPTQTSITVPTTPFTNIANTSLLLNFTNAGIFDQTAKTVLETVGDAKVSTAQYKYGTASMYFDGSGDWLLMRPNSLLNFGTGNFTVEGWFYITSSISTYRMIIANAPNSPDCYVCLRSGDVLEVVAAGALVAQYNLGGSVALNTWFHMALTRSGTTLRAFINGTSLGSVTSSSSFDFSASSGTYIGRWGGGTTYEWVGYMDDLRLTRGYARYTANFTPPSSALKDK